MTASTRAQPGFVFSQQVAVYTTGKHIEAMRRATRSNMAYFDVLRFSGTDTVCIEMAYAYG